MLPIRNISYLPPMCCNFWENCTNSHKTDLGCSTPLSGFKYIHVKMLKLHIFKPIGRFSLRICMAMYREATKDRTGIGWIIGAVYGRRAKTYAAYWWVKFLVNSVHFHQFSCHFLLMFLLHAKVSIRPTFYFSISFPVFFSFIFCLTPPPPVFCNFWRNYLTVFAHL